MDMLETIRKEMKSFEVSAMKDVIIRESYILQARSTAIKKLAQGEKNPLKMVEYCAEATMISKLIDTLAEISEDTVAEAEKLGMIEK